VDKRRQALDRRDDLMAEFLVNNAEVAEIYEQAVLSGDEAARNELDEALAARVAELEPTMTQFEVTPERKDVVPSLSYKRRGSPYAELRDKIKVTPAVNAPLYSPSVERLYDFVDKGLLDLSARPGTGDYLSDDFVGMYAHLVKERHPEYAKHKHYPQIRQRIGEQLAGMGVNISRQKWSEVASSMIPFRDEFIEAVAADEETWFDVGKRKRAQVATLMELADESTAGFQLGGKILGLVAGGVSLYGNLSKMGMTKFWGMSNVHKAKSFMATATAEVGLDMAYNPQGGTMVLGALMDDDQNRILSGIEAIALGTAFNLGIDGMRALKGKKLKNAIVELQKQLGARGDFINVLRKRVAQGEPEVPAKEMVKQPPIEIHFPKEEKLAPMRPEHEQAIEATVVTSNAKTWQRIHELEEWNKELATKHSVHRIRRNLKEIKAMKEDMGILDVESQLRANQLADAAIQQGAAETSAEAARRINLPERNLIDMDDWIKQSAETAPMREKGKWSKLAYRDGLMHGVAAPMGIGLLGGGLAMSQADEDKVGAFMAGMMLPVAPKDALKRFAKGWRARARVPGGTRKFIRKWGVPFRGSIDRVSKTMGWEVLEQQWRTMMQVYKRLETTTVYLDHMNDLIRRGVISEKEKVLIHNGLDNGKRSQALQAFDIIDKRLPAREAGATRYYFDAFERVIRDTWKEADRVGLEMGFIENYFARSISPKMYKKFLKEENIQKDSRIRAAWKAAEAESKKTLTNYEKAQIANTVLNLSGHGSGAKPGFTKTRHFTEVPERLRKYYDSFEDAQINYITQMTDAINTHKWLGVGLTKNPLKYDPREVAAIKAQIQKATGYKSAKNPGTITKTEYKRLVSQETAKLNKIRLPKYSGEYDYRGTIGDKVRRVIEKEGLDPNVEDDLTELLHARYATPMGRPSPEWVKRMRDVGYMMTIGTPYSTITQLSDLMLAASLSERGMGGTVFEAVAKKLTGGKMTYTLADFWIDPTGLERLLAELGDEAATTKWLRRNLRATGFSAIDVFGKETLINATYASLRKAARSAPDTNEFKRLVNEYATPLGDEFDDFVDALKQGNKNDDNVRTAIFGRLLDQHPAAMNEMPLGYIKHPQARIMYSLKSFTIKQIDLLRKRFLDQLLEGMEKDNKLMMRDAWRDLAKYTIMFGGAMTTTNVMKDWLLGREVEMSDVYVNHFMQLLGLHRFHIERVRRIGKSGKPSEEVLKILGGLIPPAASILADSIMPDMADMDVGGATATGAALGGAIGGLPGAAVGGGIGALTSLAGEQEMELSQGRGNELSVLGMETPIRDKYIPYLRARSWRYIPFLGRDVFWTIGRGLEWEAKRHKKPARGKRRGGRPAPAGRT